MLGAFAVATLFINPVREVITDDDFAYALMVKHLLEAGEYRLHDWAAANMPVQIYWGALLSTIFGYSFTTLRASTLVLLLVGLVALYLSLREGGASDADAGLLTLTFLASPLVVFLGFTFMSDVQFLGWLMLALWLYSRALRLDSGLAMTGATLAAAAAVGTRQFGVALPAGLALTWLLDRERWRRSALYLLGVAFPAAAGMWQIAAGLSHPTFSQAIRLREQAMHLGDAKHFLIEAVWRPTVILQYLALFSAPLALLFLISFINSWKPTADAELRECEQVEGLSRSRLLLSALATYMAGGVVYGLVRRGLLMPSIPFYLRRLPRYGRWGDVSLTIATALGGVIISWLLCKKTVSRARRLQMTSADWFPIMTLIPLLALQIVYTQFADEYLLPLLAVGLVVGGQTSHDWPRWARRATMIVALAMLSLACLWTRGALEEAEAYWRAAEFVRATGVPSREIAAKWQWNSYYGAFGEWVGEVDGDESARIEAFFDDFLQRRWSSADYRIVETLEPGNGIVVYTVPFRSPLLRRRSVHAVHQVPDDRPRGQPGGETSYPRGR